MAIPTIETFPPTESARIMERQLDGLDGHIRERQRTASEAQSDQRKMFFRAHYTRHWLDYLRLAHFLRNQATAVLGWRWAVALIGMTLSAAVFSVLFTSLWAGLIGAVLGTVLFAFLVTTPPDSRLTQSTCAAAAKLSELQILRAESCEKLTEIRKELTVLKERQRELTNKLERCRQSQQYRLDQLAMRNWKAMRGGDLEAFLVEVFAELQYLAERTGKAGDQGVDLILKRDVRRIAVQVKGYLDSVPNTAIQEAFTGMTIHRCDACAVITNSRFTSGGTTAAASVGCALIDEHTLPLLIRGQIDLWNEVLTAQARRDAQSTCGLQSPGHN